MGGLAGVWGLRVPTFPPAPHVPNPPPTACVCTYDGSHFHLGDVIYHTTDGTGGCISARCSVNGTIERKVYTCSSTTPAPPTTFSFSTPSLGKADTLGTVQGCPLPESPGGAQDGQPAVPAAGKGQLFQSPWKDGRPQLYHQSQGSQHRAEA